MNILQNGRNIYFATTVIQKALGHWDRWLLTRDEIHQQAFLHLVRWLLVRQDAKGGWSIGPELGLDLLSPYSAMVQGECASAFVRAWRLTENRSFLESARHAVKLMLKPISEGGTALHEGEAFFWRNTVPFPVLPFLTDGYLRSSDSTTIGWPPGRTRFSALFNAH